MAKKPNPLMPIDAEQALLGLILLAPEELDNCDLRPEHFCTVQHQQIYHWSLEVRMSGTPVDVITVAEAAERGGDLPVIGGLPYLTELASSGPVRKGVSGWVRIIRDAAKSRLAVDIATKLQVDIQEPDAIAAAITALMGLDRDQEAWELSIRDGLTAAYRDLESAYNLQGKIPGVTTGFKKLDAATGGWLPGDLTIIQARPAMGKTALMLAMAKAAADSGAPIGIISGEQPAAQLSARLLSMGSGVALHSIRAGQLDDDEWSRITSSMRRTVDLPVRIYDRSAPSLETVASQVRKWARSGARVVFVDYLQRMTYPQAPNRREEVSAIARGLKTLARDTNVAVVALAQSVRDVDTRGNKRPTLADIAESSDCEREADHVLSLYRDEIAERDSRDTGTAELIMLKNRHGDTGVIKVAFVGRCVRFADLAVAS